MRVVFVAIALLVFLPKIGFACSPRNSHEFQLRATTQASQPPRLGVREVSFVPEIAGTGTTCDGSGVITMVLSGRFARDINRYGVFIHVKSGANGSTPFPAYPLAPIRSHDGEVVITWGWGFISADPDGHVRWQLEVVPVSRSGVLGTPIPVCVASDRSCPRLAPEPP